MANIGLFYATDTGNTRKVAKMIKRLFDGEVDLFNVKKATAEDLQRYDALHADLAQGFVVLLEWQHAVTVEEGRCLHVHLSDLPDLVAGRGYQD